MRQIQNQFEIEVFNRLVQTQDKAKQKFKELKSRACTNPRLLSTLIKAEKQAIALGWSEFEKWQKEQEHSQEASKKLIEWIDSYYKPLIELEV